MFGLYNLSTTFSNVLYFVWLPKLSTNVVPLASLINILYWLIQFKHVSHDQLHVLQLDWHLHLTHGSICVCLLPDVCLNLKSLGHYSLHDVELLITFKLGLG